VRREQARKKAPKANESDFLRGKNSVSNLVNPNNWKEFLQSATFNRKRVKQIRF